MKFTFTQQPQDEVMIVRVGERDNYVGKLIRTGGYPNSPVWADDDLQHVLGEPFTYDGHMGNACSIVQAKIQMRLDAGEVELRP